MYINIYVNQTVFVYLFAVTRYIFEINFPSEFDVAEKSNKYSTLFLSVVF